MVKSVDRMPHSRDKRPLQVLTRSGRYPGWRKCRFTFPHDVSMQWFFEAGFTVRGGVNQGKTTSRDFHLPLRGQRRLARPGFRQRFLLPV